MVEGGDGSMPFKSAEQEIWMMINKPKIWKEWVKKYGHHPKFHVLLSKKKNKKRRKKKR